MVTQKRVILLGVVMGYAVGVTDGLDGCVVGEAVVSDMPSTLKGSNADDKQLA